jgi:hypothetical protein
MSGLSKKEFADVTRKSSRKQRETDLTNPHLALRVLSLGERIEVRGFAEIYESQMAFSISGRKSVSW